MELDELRNRVEEFLQDIRKEYYLQSAGLKDEIELNRIYSHYPGLFSLDNLSKIKNSLSESKDTDNGRKLKFLLEAFYGELLSDMSKDLSEEYFNRESKGMVSIDNNNKVAYRSSQVNMMNENSRQKRGKISINRDIFKNEQLNPLLETVFKDRQSHIQGFGFNNEIEMFQYLSSIDLHELDRSMQEFLKRTEGFYVKILEKRVKDSLNISLNDTERHDVAYMNRAREYDTYFPSSGMIETVSGFIRGMGIDFNAGNHINYDLDAREKKSPRAFCCPVKVPEEIYLVIYPRGGEEDYSAFLHELGHAMHYAYTDDDLEMEYKWFGDSSVTEGFAMAFEYLLMKEAWTKRFLGFDRNTNPDYLKHAALNELMILRRYAGKLHYEIILNQTPGLNGKDKLYMDIMNDATKIKYSEIDYLLDVDTYFYCARYLRAWMFQSQIHHGLSKRYDNRWFEKKESGDLFGHLWKTGQKYNADEVLEKNGFGKMSPDILIEDIENILLN